MSSSEELLDALMADDHLLSRKGPRNLNHLLNFSFAERERSTSTPIRRSRRPPVFNKQRYVHSNCHFILNCDPQIYVKYLTNPDLLVYWADVEEVVLVDNIPSCPICLSPPMAPKMTKCGHIYCWTCILHHLELAEKTYPPCPLCFEIVYPGDLRSVRHAHHEGIQKGDKITFTLVQRQPDTTVAVPRREWKPDLLSSIHPYDTEGKLSKYLPFQMTCQAARMTSLIRDAEDLSMQYAESVALGAADHNIPFIEMAFQQLQNRATGYGFVDLAPLLTPSDVSQACHIVRALVQTGTGHEEEKPAGAPRPAEEIPPSPFPNNEVTSSPPVETKMYWFYQASDGRPLFVHPLFLRMLAQQYGGYHNFPESLEVEVGDIEEFTQNEEFRRKYKHLSHLPLSASFSLCGINISPLVDRSVLSAFHDEFSHYKRKQQKRQQEALKPNTHPESYRDTVYVEMPIPIASPPLKLEVDFPAIAGASAPAQETPPRAASAPARGVPSYAKAASVSPADPFPSLSSNKQSSNASSRPGNAASLSSEDEENPASLDHYRKSWATAMTSPKNNASTSQATTNGNEKKSENKKKGKTVLFSTANVRHVK